MTHGWPGSVVELLETVGPLTDPTAHGGTPEDAFHLVLPSLPGYGFSGEPTELGWENGRIAQRVGGADGPPRLHALRRPGRRRRRRRHGRDGPPGTRGAARHPRQPARRWRSASRTILPAESEQERAAHDALETFTTDGFGYFLEQSTRPQTIGYSLLDSPVGLAAWMLDHDTDSYYKISRAFVDGEPVGQPHPGQHPRQHHAVLADRHRRLGRPVVLGVRTVPGRGPGGRPGSSAGRGSGRLHDVPRRDLGCPAQLGRDGLPRPRLLQRGRQAAATSPPGRSRSSSPPRCGPRSAHCADRTQLEAASAAIRQMRHSGEARGVCVEAFGQLLRTAEGDVVAAVHLVSLGCGGVSERAAAPMRP